MVSCVSFEPFNVVSMSTTLDKLYPNAFYIEREVLTTLNVEKTLVQCCRLSESEVKEVFWKETIKSKVLALVKIGKFRILGKSSALQIFADN